MKKYKVIVRTKGKMIDVNFKLVRTPTNFLIPESKIDFIKSNFRVHGITDYDIVEYVKPEPKEIETKKEVKKVKKTKKVKKKKSLLSSFLDEN